jgi:hypothetical protein
MLSWPALSDRTKPAPDGSTMPVCVVRCSPGHGLGLTATLPLAPERYHFPKARGSALREWQNVDLSILSFQAERQRGDRWLADVRRFGPSPPYNQLPVSTVSESSFVAPG